LNLDFFHQVYKNYIYGVPGVIYYLNAVPTPPVVSANPFFASVPATVNGVDLDFAMNITRNWNVSSSVSWADGKVNKTGIPCNDSNFDGIPDNGVPTAAGFQAAGVAVAKCQLSPASSTQPKWNANLQSEYFTPVTDSVDAFLRGNLVYNPSNPNNSQIYVTPAYALLDLFLGVRSPDQKWEAALFAKNVTDTKKILNEGPGYSPPANFSAVFPTTVYTQYAGVNLTPPREFGLAVHYSFGSR
jgi:iron complex outermembrane recepter protein